VFGVGPLSEGSLNESLGLSISSRGIRPGAVMFELHVLASLSELSGPVAGAVVSEQGVNSDAESSKDPRPSSRTGWWSRLSDRATSA
jgi:hypothetical protein